MKPLRARQHFGKYKIERKLGEGGFAVVYQARDTIEGVQVALKLPHPHLIDADTLADFRREVRLIARLDHPNILPLKTAESIDGHLVVVSLLGKSTLDERLTKRMSLDLAIDFTNQMLSAVAYAHQKHIVHCDLKPDNFILFEGNRLRLADFGVAQVSRRTLQASGAGTLGYMAPEQAMGRPSFQSDVFALGLVIYRMFSGKLPEWPFDWPPPGYKELREKLSPPMVALLQRSLELSPKKRFADAGAMLSAFERTKSKVRKRPKQTGRSERSKGSTSSSDWRTLRHRQFLREFGNALDGIANCPSCDGPVAEAMQCCPWCAKPRKRLSAGIARFPQQCPRCRRGMKLDWRFCPWCYGPGFEVEDPREYSDKRYVAKCHRKTCQRKLLMPFMKYCPWCRAKVRKKWPLGNSNQRCGSCGWGVARDYWSCCPWCCKKLKGSGP